MTPGLGTAQPLAVAPGKTTWLRVRILAIAGRPLVPAGARVGLSDRLTHWPGALSGGEQQRVALARALVTQPTLLLADEPTGNLDEVTAADLQTLLREMHRERGLTSIIVTHNPQLAASCDRTLKLENGRLG